MKRTYRTVFMVLAILALTVLVVGAASAATEKVSQLYDYNDAGAPAGAWLTAGKWVDAGTPVIDANGPAMSRIFPKGNPSPLNVSSTYWRISDSDDPSSDWLGTKRYTGRYLTDITKLKYMAYMRLQGSYVTSKPFYPSQPITLRLRVTANDGNLRYLMCRPWGVASQNLGDSSGNRCGVWTEYDCKASDMKWYEGWTMTVYDNWNDMLTNPAYNLHDAVLVDTVPGPDYCTNTATGASLNFVLGPETKSDTFLGAWWREAWNAEAAMDGFTIKFAGDTDDTVFDFHFTAPNNWRNLVTDPAYAQDREYRQYYGMNNRDVKSQLIVGTHCYTYVSWYGKQCYEDAPGNNWSNTMANYNSAGQVIYGRVVADGYVNTERFKIDDGSGKLIPVWAPGSSAYQNDYVRVRGSLAFPQFYFLDGSMKWFPATFYSYGGVEAIME